MPLTEFQKSVMEVLRPFRNHQTFVGGGAALNAEWPRLSDDLDIFNDVRRSLPDQIEAELQVLRGKGFSVEVDTRDELIVEAIVRQFDRETKIQWLDEPETSMRFFPAVVDEEFGFRLHQTDNAINKVLTAARRQSAARDAVDLVSIVRGYAPLGPIIWALPAKHENLTPPKILQSLRANAFGYADVEIATVRVVGEPVTRRLVRDVLKPAFDSAAAYCDGPAPIELLGRLLVNADDVPVEAVQQDIDDGRVRALTIRNFGAVARMVR